MSDLSLKNLKPGDTVYLISYYPYSNQSAKTKYRKGIVTSVGRKYIHVSCGAWEYKYSIHYGDMVPAECLRRDIAFASREEAEQFALRCKVIRILLNEVNKWGSFESRLTSLSLDDLLTVGKLLHLEMPAETEILEYD